MLRGEAAVWCQETMERRIGRAGGERYKHTRNKIWEKRRIEQEEEDGESKSKLWF